MGVVKHDPAIKTKRITRSHFGFSKFLVNYLFRLCNAFLLLTYFQPDEYFQAWEPAYLAVHGVGYKTWEWRVGLRTSLVPRLFELIIRISDHFKVDHLVLGKFVMAFVAACADFYTGKVAEMLLNSRKLGKWAWYVSMASTFNWYCLTRPFSNTFETALIITAFYYFRKNTTWLQATFAHILAHISIALRPSAAVFWLHVGLYQVFTMDSTKNKRLKYIIFSIGMTIISQLAILALDLFYYQPMTIIPYFEFFKFNLIYNFSSLYGQNDMFWYFVQGLPFLLLGYVPFFILGWGSTPKLVKHICCLNVFLMSLISHKEQRFLFFLLPFMHISVSLGYNRAIAYGRKYRKKQGITIAVCFLSVLVNIVVSAYLSGFHMRGVNAVIKQIRFDESVTDVTFLMPCHATPWHSHFQRLDSEFHPKFLSCEPPLNDHTNMHAYRNEVELFYENPERYLHIHPELLSETIVAFEPLEPLLESYGYHATTQYFNGLFADDSRKQGNILVLRKQSEHENQQATTNNH